MRRTTTAALAVAGLLGLATFGPAPAQEPAEKAKELLARVEKLAKERQYDEAADVVNKLLELLPGNDDVLSGASEVEHHAGRYADGLKHAQQAIKIAPKSVHYLRAATNAYALQDLKLARQYVEKVLAMSEADVPPVVRYRARELDEQTAPRTYTLHWKLDPRRGVVVSGATTVALPRGDLPGQSVTYEVKGAGSHKVIKTEANHLLRIALKGAKPFQLTMKITMKPHSYKEELQKATKGPIPKAVQQAYLGPCESVNPKSPALTKIVSGLKSADHVETARNILKWMKKNIEYKLETAGVGKVDFAKVEELLKRGHAECRGYAMLFVGLCRAAGVPARPVWGLVRVPPTPDRPKGSWASHNWAEVYFPGSGWIPVDPQKPETLGWLPSNIIRIYMDVRRTATTQEHLPMRNLVHMNGDTIDFEVSP
jgi:transglutaminase-like putative cysteine protease